MNELYIKPNYTPFVKGEKVRIIFMHHVASFWPCIESVYRALVADERFDVRVVFVSENSVEHVQSVHTEEHLRENNISYVIYSEEFIKEFRPHVAIYQPQYDASHRLPSAFSLHLRKLGVRIVHIPYGIEYSDTVVGNAQTAGTFVVRNAWRIFVMSEAMAAEYHKFCTNRHAVRALGHPKFDYNTADFKQHAEVAERFCGRPIITWQMHFPKYDTIDGKRMLATPELSVYKEFAQQVGQLKDVFIVFRPHPFCYSRTTVGDEIIGKLEEIFGILEACENVFIDRTDDYRNSLYNGDAIITDRSALMVEAGPCNVPVMYMSNPEYWEPLSPPIHKLVMTYEQGQTAAQMISFCKSVADGSATVSEEMQQAINEVIPYRDGLIGKRIVDHIYESLASEKDEPLRLALVGLGNVYNFYKEYFNLYARSDMKVVAIADNNPNKVGTKLDGLVVSSLMDLRDVEFDMLVIMLDEFHTHIRNQLLTEVLVDDERILRLDEFAEWLLDQEQKV